MYIDGNFYGFIGVGVVRGLCALGIGVLASFISGYISIPHDKKTFGLFSIGEIILFVIAMSILIRPTNFDITTIQIIFALLLLAFINSVGILSSCLNKIKFFGYIGKYSFSIYLLHIVPLKLFRETNLSDVEYMLVVLLGATFLGILSYNIVELPLLRKFKMKYQSRCFISKQMSVFHSDSIG